MKQWKKDFESTQNMVRSVCYKYKHNDYVCFDDLVQEATIRLWSASKSFKGRSKFSTFAHRVVNNACIDYVRKCKLQIKTDSIDDIVFVAEYEETDLSIEQLYLEMEGLINDLNKENKYLINCYLRKIPYKDIAEKLGTTEGNIKIKMMRAKKELKK